MLRGFLGICYVLFWQRPQTVDVLLKKGWVSRRLSLCPLSSLLATEASQSLCLPKSWNKLFQAETKRSQNLDQPPVFKSALQSSTMASRPKTHPLQLLMAQIGHMRPKNDTFENVWKFTLCSSKYGPLWGHWGTANHVRSLRDRFFFPYFFFSFSCLLHKRQRAIKRIDLLDFCVFASSHVLCR